MKANELIKILEQLDNKELKIYVPSRQTEYDYCIAQSIEAKFLIIDESEEYPDETLVLIIDEC